MATRNGPKRDAGETADRIRMHARLVFCEKGYDLATTREIADRAHVNVALINRYFGSKLGLFEDAVVSVLSLEPFLEGPLETLGVRMADFYVDARPKDGFDPFVTLLRSVASDEAGPVLLKALKRQALDPLSKAMNGTDTAARATLLTTQMAGLIVKFRIFGLEPETDNEREAIRAMLRRYFTLLVDGDSQKDQSGGP
ncbi:MAG: TetR family transcriptional regulator [Pseudomonadota bacterium]